MFRISSDHAQGIYIKHAYTRIKHIWIIKCVTILALKNCRNCKACSRCRCRYSCYRTLWYLQLFRTKIVTECIIHRRLILACSM